MPRNTLDKDFRTLGYVLRRTNYGEADRILNIITPKGKIAAIAKGVRREKSKLAGGVEMFSLVDLNIHRGRSELMVVTSAKMIKYYSNILKDFARMELAALILKKINIAAESSDNSEFFDIVDQGLAGLDLGLNLELVEVWFWLRLLKGSGEEVNLYWDIAGQKLSSEKRYNYDVMEKAFVEDARGEFGVNEIKMLRLMLTTKLVVVARVKDAEMVVPKVLRLARIVSGAI